MNLTGVQNIPKKILKAFLSKNYEDKLAMKKIEVTEAFGMLDLEDRTIIGVTSYLQYSTYTAETKHTVIRVDRRGEGLGSILSSGLEVYLKSIGYKKLTSRVFTHNIPMVVSKIKSGWIVEGTLKDHDLKGSHDYVMSKFI